MTKKSFRELKVNDIVKTSFGFNSKVWGVRSEDDEYKIILKVNGRHKIVTESQAESIELIRKSDNTSFNRFNKLTN